MRRRAFLVTAALAAAGAPAARAQRMLPAADLAPLIAAVTLGEKPEEGGIELEIPQLAENGNSVPLRIRVASPMTAADHVTSIHVFAERNPSAQLAVFRFGPGSGRAEVTTRIRLASAQTVTVLAAQSGRRYRIARADVHVTAAACIDESFLPT